MSAKAKLALDLKGADPASVKTATVAVQEAQQARTVAQQQLDAATKGDAVTAAGSAQSGSGQTGGSPASGGGSAQQGAGSGNLLTIADPSRYDFRIQNQQDMLQASQNVDRSLTLLLGGIGGISLLVGGIGIMTIMLVSLTERTKEIGIRKAIGAPPEAILAQFLVEAVVLSLAGGALGIALGFGVAQAVSRVAGWPALVPPLAVVVAFAFAAAIGLFFGIYPARRAARLDPIVALRHE